MKLKLLDLFSGIGGFSLGFESTGFFETIGFVEKDKFCQKVLKKHWSNINIEEDIRNVKGEKYAADIITGGFPCQPFSVAGKRKSTTDDRYLWDEMLRVIREVKPIWIVAENVEGIVNINEGMVLRQVLTDLEKEGFKSQCIIIPASGIGAWHQRKRIWIIANSKSSRTRQNKRGLWESVGGIDGRKTTNKNVPNSNTRLSIRENKEVQTGWNAINNGSKDVSNSDSKGLAYSNESKLCTSEQQRLDNNKKRIWSKIWSFSSRCCEQIESRKTWWQTQSRICGVPNGVSYELDKDRSNRIKALGNSIVPQIARQIGLAILTAEGII